jgi:hypothetical protein
MPDVQHQVPAVLGDEGVKVQLRSIRAFIDQPIVALRGAEGVPVEPIHQAVFVVGRSVRYAIPAIIKPGVVVRPGDAGELAPLEHFSVVFSAIDPAYTNLLPVAAVAGEPVGEQHAVATVGLIDQRDRAVGGEKIWIQNFHWLTVESLLHVEHILVLQPVVPGKEVA